MGLEKVGLVKIDAEHFELDVLAGMADTIKDSGPDILVEVTNANFEKVIQVLQTVHPDYHCIQVNENRCKLIHNSSVKAQGCRNLFFTRRSGTDLQRIVSQAEARAKRYLAANT
jgi:Methyltransferase FkbM domain